MIYDTNIQCHVDDQAHDLHILSPLTLTLTATTLDTVDPTERCSPLLAVRSTLPRQS